MNDINEMPPKCQYCPYWEICEYPWVCPDMWQQDEEPIQQTCHATDTISRRAAIEAVHKSYDMILDFKTDGKTISSSIEDILSNLPSAQPKHGYWIESHEHIYIANGVKEWTNWYCSECDAPNDKPTDYCPNCGTDMRGES